MIMHIADIMIIHFKQDVLHDEMCAQKTRHKVVVFKSKDCSCRRRSCDSKKFVVRFRFYWRPPEGFYFHWRGLKNCFLQLKTLRRVIYIPLEGFRCPSFLLTFHTFHPSFLFVFTHFFHPVQPGYLNPSSGIINPQEGYLNPSSGIINPLEG